MSSDNPVVVPQDPNRRLLALALALGHGLQRPQPERAQA